MIVRPRPAPPDLDWPRRWAPRVALLAALLAGWHAAFGPAMAPRPAPTRWTTGAAVPVPAALTPWYVQRIGQDAVESFLRARDGGRPLKIIQRARRAVVRIKVSGTRPNFAGKITFSGSGVLVSGGGHVLTAGHVLDGREGLENVECSIVLTDGRSFRGALPGVRGGVDGAPEGDWGMVEVMGEFPEDLPTLPFGTAAPDSTVVMLGYPNGLGMDSRGTIRPNDTLPGVACYPLAYVGEAKGAWSGLAKIVAGTETGGGSSGGAIVDLEGNLVGLMTQCLQGWRWNGPLDTEQGETQSSNCTFTNDVAFNGTPVGVFREYVEQIWKR